MNAASSQTSASAERPLHAPNPIVHRPAEARGDVPRCLGWGFLITVLHLAVVLYPLTPSGGLVERYHRLSQHDSYWFLNIIGRGYQSPVPPSPVKRMEVSNVAFFPGFPLWGEAVIKTLNVHPKTGLALASQVATWGFWTYFLLIARRRLAFSWKRTAAAAGLVLAHPAAFFLIAAYSESLFLFFLLGYLFWSVREGRGAFWLTTLHGVGMTGTRIAGAPAAAFPAVRAWLGRTGGDGKPWRFFQRFAEPGVWRGVALMALSLTGMIAFFVFCHVGWGHWNFYMMTQEAGWGVRADYLGLFKPFSYSRWWPNWPYASQVGQLLVPLTMIFLVGAAIWEVAAARVRRTHWRERLGLYFVGFFLFYISVSGVFSVKLESMTRYHFCAHVFFVLAALHACTEIGPRQPKTRRALLALTLLVAAWATYLHLNYAWQFVRGGWVA